MVRILTPFLQIKDLRINYIDRDTVVQAVRGVNLNINKGEIIGLAGETGCGKTTLALSIPRLLASNARIESGEIIFDGENLLSLMEEEMIRFRQKRVSLILQGTSQSLNPQILAGLQVAEAIEFHKREPFHEAIKKTREIFSEVGLGTNVLISLPQELSPGIRQRVKIALAISTEPDLIIADEPFIGLDSLLQAQISDLISKLHEKYGLTALIASHEIPRLFEISDKIAIMYAGKIVEFSEKADIYKNPIHPYTKGLIGAIPNLRFIKERRLIEIPGEPPSAVNPPEGCAFWPRCPYAKDICKEDDPPILNIKNTQVACHYADELKDLSPWDFWFG